MATAVPRHRTGALIANVTEGGPAAEHEIQARDVITKFDGKPVVKMRRLPRIVAETPVGKDVEIEIWRNGMKLSLNVTLGEFPEEPRAIAAKPRSEQALRVAGSVSFFRCPPPSCASGSISPTRSGASS